MKKILLGPNLDWWGEVLPCYEGLMIGSVHEVIGEVFFFDDRRRTVEAWLWKDVIVGRNLLENSTAELAKKPLVDIGSVAEAPAMRLSNDSDVRKNTPIFSGVLNYFPLAMAEIAKLSKLGNDKHNPGQPLHWAKEKSTDHKDCIARHLIDAGTIDPDSKMYHDVGLAWRALANLETLLEK